ncbi:hypothetical protein IQ249_13090 [Lusitaniella coriacea LEGE 07157]|uniref:Uncharacterized protein n=1 Tax=Lusitaniella coriacea LEGE 07157 TaxID=945747 RepID=A0A8J7DX62_9CYAN|nr:hypothetical protein [Lusitaniella coriacea]MBE9116836.1 hypothetical protein [Lusitaniella coriacea LEGE 07157]
MGAAFHYYQLVAINGTGARRIVEIAAAKSFFFSAFPQISPQSNVPNAPIQRQLLEWVRANSPETEKKNLAERCLLCFISWQSDRACTHLEVQFGSHHGFRASDLLPFVLDDDGTIPTPSTYQTFAQSVLQSFKPKQGSLSTWTNLRVKHHSELNHFLLECGVYLIGDWAILNDTNSQQLERIFRDFHRCTDLEIQCGKALLTAYHAIYRADRLLERRQRSHRGTRRCKPPSVSQLERMAALLPSPIDPEDITTQLQTIATRLRSYRIHVRGGTLMTESLDKSQEERVSFVEQRSAATSNPLKDAEDRPGEFLQSYRKEFLNALEDSLASVATTRFQKLQCREPGKAKNFLTALHLFHCEDRIMSDIAKEVGLKAQYQVARLLKLKAFRADVRQQLLVLLRDRVLKLAKAYTAPERLYALNRELEVLLEEQIDRAIDDAQTATQTRKTPTSTSLFARILCRHLNSSRTSE